MMNPMQLAVKSFHKANGLPISETPVLIPADRAKLRVKMLQEELDELKEAYESGNLVEVYDALCDILYLAYGDAVEGGMEIRPGFFEVQRSNMSKLGADGKPIISRGEELDGFPAGKVLKGPNYFKPRLNIILIAQGAKLDE